MKIGPLILATSPPDRTQPEVSRFQVELRVFTPKSTQPTIAWLKLREPAELVQAIIKHFGDWVSPTMEATTLVLSNGGSNSAFTVFRPGHLNVMVLVSGPSRLAEFDFLTTTQRRLLLRFLGGADVQL